MARPDGVLVSHRCRVSLCWPSHASTLQDSSGVRPPAPSSSVALSAYPSARCPVPPSRLPHVRWLSRLHRYPRSHARCDPASVTWPLREPRSSRSSLRLVLRRAGAPLLRPLLTSRSAQLRAASPFQAQGEISPGKNADLPCTTAGSTPPGPWSRELRGHVPARPARLRLISGSCSSARRFAPCFLHAVLAVRRSALHFARCDQLTGGLSPPSQRPCRAHTRKARRAPRGALLASISAAASGSLLLRRLGSRSEQE